MWVRFHGRRGGKVATEAFCPSQEHGTAPGAPGAQLVLPARPLLGGEPGLWSGRGEEAGGGGQGSWRTGLKECLALKGSPSSSLSQQFSPVSAMEPVGQQVPGLRGLMGRRALPVACAGATGQGTYGKGQAPFVFCFFQLTGGQTQEKLSPLTFLKLGNQVQPGGAGEERAGSEGGRLISRGREAGGVAARLRPDGRGWEGPGRAAPSGVNPARVTLLLSGLGQDPAVPRHRGSEGVLQHRTWR